MGGGQQGHLDAGGETARIGHMLSLCNLLFINLWQTIDIIMIALNTEVLCEVDDLDVPWDGVLLEECLALAMCTSLTRLPALLSELAKTISASGWLSNRRISSPPV